MTKCNWIDWPHSPGWWLMGEDNEWPKVVHVHRVESNVFRPGEGRVVYSIDGNRHVDIPRFRMNGVKWMPCGWNMATKDRGWIDWPDKEGVYLVHGNTKWDADMVVSVVDVDEDTVLCEDDQGKQCMIHRHAVPGTRFFPVPFREVQSVGCSNDWFDWPDDTGLWVVHELGNGGKKLIDVYEVGQQRVCYRHVGIGSDGSQGICHNSMKGRLKFHRVPDVPEAPNSVRANSKDQTVTNEELNRAVGKILELPFKEGDPHWTNGAPFLPSSDANDAVVAAMDEELFDGDCTLCRKDGKWLVHEDYGHVLVAEDGQFGRAICKAIIKLHSGDE